MGSIIFLILVVVLVLWVVSAYTGLIGLQGETLNA